MTSRTPDMSITNDGTYNQFGEIVGGNKTQNYYVYERKNKPFPESVDHRALMLYVENIRDIEVAKDYISSQIIYLEAELRKDLMNYPEAIEKIRFPSDEKRPSGVVWVIICILTLIDVYLVYVLFDDYYYCISWLDYFVKGILILLIVLITVPLLLMIINASLQESEYYSNFKKVEKYNSKATRTEKQNSLIREQLIEEFDEKKEKLKRDQEKTEDLLTEFYSVNIIPSKFRDVNSIIYISDYMLTSQASLENILFHTNIEDGINKNIDVLQRKEEIRNNISINRCINECNEVSVKKQIKHNKDMLKTLQVTERNAINTNFYSRLTSLYDKANEYFRTVMCINQNVLDN